MFTSKYWSTTEWDCFHRDSNEFAWDDENGRLCTEDIRTADLFKLLDALYEYDNSIMINTTEYKPQFGMSLTSGYRTEEANEACGGEIGSYHTKGCAADIHFESQDYTDFEIAGIVLEVSSYLGLDEQLGIGYYGDWCHIDTRGYTSRW